MALVWYAPLHLFCRRSRAEGFCAIVARTCLFSEGRCDGKVRLMGPSDGPYPCRGDVAPASPAVAAAPAPDAALTEEGPTAQKSAETVLNGYELSLVATVL